MDSYIIQRALERAHRNVTAKTLRTTRETLRYRVQKYHLRAAAESEDQCSVRGATWNN